jgi:hypothetical protein
MKHKHLNTRYQGGITIEDNDAVYFRDLLAAVREYNALCLITKRVKRKKPNVHRSLNKLIIRGFVTKTLHEYYLTPLGFSVLNSKRYPGIDGVSMDNGVSMSVDKKCRLHHFSVTLDFWHTPSNWEKQRLRVFGLGLVDDHYKKNPYRFEVSDVRVNPCFKYGGTQSFKWGDFRVICYANSVRVWLPEILGEDADYCTGEALRLLWDFIPRLEHLLYVPRESLLKEERLNMRVSTRHYAIVGAAFAKYLVKGKGVNQWFVSIDGIKRLLVDNSVKSDGRRGLEFEAVSKVYSEDDIVKITRYNEDILKNPHYLPSECSEYLNTLMCGFNLIAPVIEGLGYSISNLYNGGVRYYGRDS